MEPKRILMVDDERQITRVLRHSFLAHGYDVRTASDGESALDTIRDFVPDLVITDLQMPEMSGLELCRKIRAVSQIPIIVLSIKGEERIKVAALDAGADDYVTKPFGMDELLARVRAALRRGPAEPVSEESVLTAGDFEIDRSTHRALVRGAEIHLTPKEMELLIYLLTNSGRVLTHRSMLKALWGANAVEQPEYLRVFVGNLRKKIEPDLSAPKYIITEPWVGYRFEPAG
ncbi:MAG: response regulator transcription factor [Pyrinomonadaceae bacterium]